MPIISSIKITGNPKREKWGKKSSLRYEVVFRGEGFDEITLCFPYTEFRNLIILCLTAFKHPDWITNRKMLVETYRMENVYLWQIMSRLRKAIGNGIDFYSVSGRSGIYLIPTYIDVVICPVIYNDATLLGLLKDLNQDFVAGQECRFCKG